VTGHEVSFIGFKLGNWSDEQDLKLLSEYNLKGSYLSATRSPFRYWLSATIVHRLSKCIWPLRRKSKKLAAFADHKRCWQLVHAMKMMNFRVDLVVAHNLAALYPAWWYARKYRIPFNFDVEDYYPGERTSGRTSQESLLRKGLMSLLMPDAHYVTFAAPLIRERVLKEIPMNKTRAVLINNTFPASEFRASAQTAYEDRVKLIWFSQKISYFRGLEPVITLLTEMKERFSLTLIGAIDLDFYHQYIKDKPDLITCQDPLPQKDLHRRLSEYDVGLAIEDADSDMNRDICLTNKIWAYYLSGLYILATDTRAQRDFLNTRPGHGKVFTSNSLEDTLTDISNHIEMIREKREERQRQALTESFEAEIPKLEAAWRI